MRERLAIFFLAAGNTAWRLLLILAGMAAAQTAAFVAAMHRIDGSLDQVFKGSGIMFMCAAGLILYCVALCFRVMGGKSSRTSYVLNRLSVSEKTVFAWWVIYNTLCFLIFWGVQVIILLLCCCIFTGQAEPGTYGAQTIFITFQENGFLHGMLPLGNPLRYLVNMILVLTLGITTAPNSMGTETKKVNSYIYMLVTWIILYFNEDMVGNMGWAILLFISALVVTIVLVRILAIGGVWNEKETG